MSGVIVTDPPEADAEHAEALAGYGVGTVGEAMGRTGLLGPEIRPVQQGVRLAGIRDTQELRARGLRRLVPGRLRARHREGHRRLRPGPTGTANPRGARADGAGRSRGPGRPRRSPHAATGRGSGEGEAT
ncbi:hypothetical protein GCM10010279_58500 [Streptomyces mutabilis]|nr:hypothetical protein GCM10010279_58500 [Streptomyces mutabilis]